MRHSALFVQRTAHDIRDFLEIKKMQQFDSKTKRQVEVMETVNGFDQRILIAFAVVIFMIFLFMMCSHSIVGVIYIIPPLVGLFYYLYAKRGRALDELNEIKRSSKEIDFSTLSAIKF